MPEAAQGNETDGEYACAIDSTPPALFGLKVIWLGNLLSRRGGRSHPRQVFVPPEASRSLWEPNSPGEIRAPSGLAELCCFPCGTGPGGRSSPPTPRLWSSQSSLERPSWSLLFLTN